MLRQLNETARHGLAADEAHRPERPDWTIDQGWSSYTAQEHGVCRRSSSARAPSSPDAPATSFSRG